MSPMRAACGRTFRSHLLIARDDAQERPPEATDLILTAGAVQSEPWTITGKTT
jgi:hypothetical protein